jgi:hypothetical protein
MLQRLGIKKPDKEEERQSNMRLQLDPKLSHGPSSLSVAGPAFPTPSCTILGSQLKLS